ncbi:hypothetical protein DXG01_001056 [Tephrocybe rancida]|nr:hypothetical protein DXG01_001056 [Tephrocybe rancida]
MDSTSICVDQFKDELSDYTPDGEPVLDTFAEVQQIWHLWRRRYDLFLREGHRRIFSTASETQPEPEITTMSQFANVDMGFLSWHFKLLNGDGEDLAYINRAFRGFGREIFTDTGRYTVTFGPGAQGEGGELAPTTVLRHLTLDERALTLALAEMYVLPPYLANGALSYAELYAEILATYRSSPLSSASSVTMLVSTDVDALCAARMLSTLLQQDDIIHRIIPTPGFTELMEAADDAVSNPELRTLIMLNVGGILDLATEEWFGKAGPRLKIHIIDSARPLQLANYYEAPDVCVWDDGSVEKIGEQLHKSFDVTFTAPEYPSEDDESDTDSEDDEELEHSEDDDEDDFGERDSTSGKRRSLSHGDRSSKRRRTSRDRSGKMSREEYKFHQDTVTNYYNSGTSHAQSASATIYILATVLERVDNDLLWLAILGLTHQYITSRISREYYDTQQRIYDDEVSRLNPLPPDGALTSLNPDDASVRASDELRFMLFRHWTLYDAMFHSSYVASKLGIWKERGRKRLTGLLAKIGFSIGQTQQPYAHMDMDLKRDLVQKLNDVAPEYGLVELSYPSFMRCFGYKSQPLSAADAVEGISALMDVAGGVRIDVEVEGARNGGEWFGGGKAWEANAGREFAKKRRDGESSEQQQPEQTDGGQPAGAPSIANKEDLETKRTHNWWIKNFWTAYDALTDIGALRDALRLSMALHRAIIRQGTSIIDKQDIKTMQGYRVVILSQGPDLALFTHPSVLSRLAMWLVDALRDRIPSTTNPRTKKKSLPFVVACLNETTDTYMLVGVTAALDFGDVRKNEFSQTFLSARKKSHAETRHASFDMTVLELPQKDLKIFLDALCEGPDDDS